MLTDEDLTGQLRLAFADATQDMAPAPGLMAAVHRRHRAARRRGTALRIAIPAAAACAGGAVVAGGGAEPSAHPPTSSRSTSVVPTSARSRPAIRTVDYLLKVPAQAGGSFSCLDPDAAHVSPDTGTWFVAVSDCTVMVVDTDTSLPADAQPIELAGIPGLYATTDAGTNAMTIYSGNPDGTWSALTVAADTPDQSLRGFYTPAG